MLLWRPSVRDFYMGSRRLKISGGFYLMMAAMLLLVPLPWLIAAAVAGAYHELWHYLAICYLSGQSNGLRLNAFAARLPLPEMSRGKELLCALAGPVGGLSLVLFARWMPRLAICAVMQSAYNLLPIYPLDGGRALQNGLLMAFKPPVSRRICKIVERICKTMILLAAIYGCLWLRLGLFPLWMVALLLLRLRVNGS